jgi:hypothetical protein
MKIMILEFFLFIYCMISKHILRIYRISLLSCQLQRLREIFLIFFLCRTSSKDIWYELFDPTTNRLFYANPATGACTWTRPNATHIMYVWDFSMKINKSTNTLFSRDTLF